MSRRRKATMAAILMVAAALLLLPVVPYSVTNGKLAFMSEGASATVSPTYAAFQCGTVYNPSSQYHLGSMSAVSGIWNGTRWTCGTGWAHPPWA